MDFNVTVRDYSGNEITHNLQDELRINKHDLSSEMESQPSKYIYWAFLQDKASSLLEGAELERDRIYASLYEPKRQALVASGTAKPTKDQINSAILADTDYTGAEDKVKELSEQFNNMKYIVKAFEQRKDMLIQLGSDARKEREYNQALNNYQS